MSDTERATVMIRHLLEGKYSSPFRIVAFNTAEGWSRDVSHEIATELTRACADHGERRHCRVIGARPLWP